MSYVDEQPECEYIDVCPFSQVIDYVDLEKLASPDSRKELKYAKSIVYQVLCVKHPEHLSCPIYQNLKEQNRTTQTKLF